MLISFPGAGCDPGVIDVVDCKPVGNGCDKHKVPAVSDADEVESVMERDLASLGNPSCLKSGWFGRLSRGSLGTRRRRAASERRKELRVRDGLGRAIREADQPGLSLRLQGQGQCGPGNAHIVHVTVETDTPTASDATGEGFGRLRAWWRGGR